MKKVILLMLGLVAGTASFAQKPVSSATAHPEPQVHIVAKSNQKVQFFVQPMQATGRLSLQDEQGHTLYSSNVSLKGGLGQQFDVANLGTGTYRIILTTGSETVTKTFAVESVPYMTQVVLES